jgi:peptidoglycan/xylan/chitin deacetylase (PgdA/CDA1 family)
VAGGRESLIKEIDVNTQSWGRETSSRRGIVWALLAGMISVLLFAVPRAGQDTAVTFVGKTKYLNDARAVVVHSIDDSTKLVVETADAMDKYGIKGTFFISTELNPPPEERFFNQLQVWLLWPRMKKAVEDGHEVGSHAVTHPCGRPQSEEFCKAAYSDTELTASRDEILRRTSQPYVWTWAYPCGHCAEHEFIQKRLAAAGYIVARNYPGEAQGLHIRPDLQTWATNVYDAPYTQVVQKRGGRRGGPPPPAVDVPDLNAKFDEVYGEGGIYHFMSHPQSLDFGPEGFYEKHLAHIARRADVWYVPMGPVYAFRTLVERTDVKPLDKGGAKARFAVSNNLDRKIYNGSVTLEFTAPPATSVRANGKRLTEGTTGMTDRWTEEYIRRDGARLLVTVRPNATLEFR